MNSKKALYVISALLTLVLFVPFQGQAQLIPYEGGPTKPGMHAPIITHAFAVDRGYYGDTWKIYVEAEDPGGQMLRIASVVDQVGYGYYPTDWIYLKPQDEKHFKGYLQWNTYSNKARYLPEWTQISLKVSVFDKNGNESNEVVFPFTFEVTPKQYVDKPPAPFNQGDVPRLGYIAIDLVNPLREHEDRDPGMMR